MKRIALAVGITAVLTIAIAALLINIFERKQEGRNAFFRVVDLDDNTDDPAVWGKNFPLQYDSYKRTVDMERTRYGGSEAIRQPASDRDPRDVVSQSKIDEDPRLKKMWLGYAFSVDFREERGHAYMLIDQRETERVKQFKQPGTCLNCHASTYTFMKKLGDGDTFKGFERMNQMTYAEATQGVKHPVSCIDCHDSQTMQLRVTRPAFIEGIRNLKGDQNYDPNTMASAQEMRSFVCGQCHVEYYFKGDEKRLTFPWHKGLQVDNMLAYYNEVGFKDFTHAESGAPVLKAQHPEFEMYSQGVHARSGVSCADCHMPYKREGGMKISDHHVRSPLLNINRACQGCHRFPEEEIKARVEQIQGRFIESRNLAMDALMELIDDIKAAKAKGATDAQLKEAWAMQRKAQFFIDFVEAENSAGFHAPGETLRVLTQALDACRKGQLALKAL
ncbi:MAG TPA: ammonia-forming cytochrome c nitrite reductase subunit c552 [Bryobacteraceae bacterium]|nr:ammonia-forming cytochrome c nitrite reductase subunit c552 [Bryobacterales bacterium]HRJ20959.1 ammonia-forming cytochrome c nitrite reductase subunit c552 [Bryobacteraceae bacterium]